MLRFRKTPIAIAAAIGCFALPISARGQTKAYSLTDVLELVQGSVKSSRILRMIGKSCLSFKVSKEIESVFRNAGGDNALIAGLRSFCYKSDEAAPTPPRQVSKKPSSKPVSADGTEETQVFTDAVGDARADKDGIGPSPDLRTVSTTIISTGIRWLVRFDSATFNPHNTQIYIAIDADGDSRTGNPNLDGADVSLILGGTRAWWALGDFVRFSANSASVLSAERDVQFYVTADGYSFFLPFDRLPVIGPTIRFRISSRQLIKDGRFTTAILDYAPDSGRISIPVKIR